ncbi:zinc metallo proteinase [Xylariomycetidae sp. FL0641]|nr:zinc metallo proteinase [Xylariomycetidae sp. FL0641]
MPPAWVKEFRRRSMASFRTTRSTDTSSNEEQGSQETTPTQGSITPPSLAGTSDPALSGLNAKNGYPEQPISAPAPQRPPFLAAPSSHRHSVPGLAGLGSPIPTNGNGKSKLPVSQYAPRFLNLQEGTWVSQKVLLVSGIIGDGVSHKLDGTLTVIQRDDSFPPVEWPVSQSRFKALVYLHHGPNRLCFDFQNPKLANHGGSNPLHATYITVHMLPTLDNPPLQLAILMGSDSQGTYDAVPARVEREGNGLDTAVRKYRMAAYLWQAFTGESMWRNQLQRRTFRFEEEWVTGTSNSRDMEMGNMRSEARIHIIRANKTVAELRDLERAQQNEKATKKGELYEIAADAVKDYFKPLPGQKLYVSVMLLDSHWDPAANVVTAHAALGGNAGDLSLAIFGSHCLQSYPTRFEEVVPAFTDCTPTDTRYVANDCNESGSSWEAANIGIGAHLHETGHLFGCPHQESGIMLRDYVRLHRSFLSHEAFSTRTKEKGKAITSPDDECSWHPLDCFRFRTHPCFRLPGEAPAKPDAAGVQVWPVENSQVIVCAATGVAWIELYPEGDTECHTWISYFNEPTLLRNLTLTESQLRERLPEAKRRAKLRISIKSHGGGSLDIDDFQQLCSKVSICKLPSGNTAYRGKQLGFSQMEGSEPQEFAFTSATRQDRVMSRVIVYHGFGLDGLEFVYDDNSTQLFGKRGGKPGGDTFELGECPPWHIIPIAAN